MFSNTKYTKTYFKIIEAAKKRMNEDGMYLEKHHIIPRCLGGEDVENNLVHLTAREHYIVHLLLTKMNPSPGLIFAYFLMVHGDPHQKRRISPNSKIYSSLKEKAKKACIIRNKSYNWPKGYVTANKNGVTKRFDSIEKIPEGWVRGSPTSGKTGKQGRKYFFDPVTNEVRAFFDITTVPEGWMKGNPNANKGSSKLKGRKNYHNPILKLTRKFYEKDVPEGWVKGSGKIIINNRDSERHIFVWEDVPEGWYKGRLPEMIRKREVTRRKNYKNRLHTPFGIFIPLEFCSIYGVDRDILNLDRKFNVKNLKEKHIELYEELQKISYDFSKTRKENGFYLAGD